MLTTYYFIIATALVMMAAGFVMIVRLRRITTGGTIGRVVNIIYTLVIIFTLGYVVALYMPLLPKEANLILVSLIFLFGAVFVVLVLWLIRNLIKQVMNDLKPVNPVREQDH